MVMGRINTQRSRDRKHERKKERKEKTKRKKRERRRRDGGKARNGQICSERHVGKEG